MYLKDPFNIHVNIHVGYKVYAISNEQSHNTPLHSLEKLLAHNKKLLSNSIFQDGIK